MYSYVINGDVKHILNTIGVIF